MTPADVGMISAGCAVAGFVIDRLVHPGRGLHKRLNDFFEDWNGEQARPGVKAREGVMVRLEKIEHQLNGGGFGGRIADLDGKVTALDGKVTAHIEHAQEREQEMRGDVRDARADLFELGRVFSVEQQKLEERITSRIEEIDEKVTERLTEQTDRAHYLEGVARELLRDDDDV